MATSVNLNGVSYSIPATGEGSWGTNVSNYLIALSTGVLQKAGGSFTLTADVDFGVNYGLKSIYYKSRATASSAGVLRLGNNESVGWRNAANGADKLLKVNASDVLEFDGNPIVTLALGTADYVLKMNSAGTAYSFAQIIDASVKSDAAIAHSKMAALTASRALVSDGSGVVSVATTTATQIGYLSSATGTTGTTSTNIVFSTSPTLVTPVLGAATATSINGLTITSSTGTLTITNGKTLSVSNTLTFTGTDASSVAFGTGGTVAYRADNLSVFAATTSAQLAGVISDETGSGALVFATSPSLTTPTLGVATATSINGLTITSSTGTLTITNGKTLSVSNSLTFAGTDGNTMTFPSGSSTVMTLGAAGTVTGAKTFAQTTLLLQDNSTNTVTLSTTNATTSHTLKLPAAQGGANTVLTNDGSGNLTWGTALTNPMDSAGDMIYGGAAGAATKLDSGTSQTWLVSGGAGAPSWTNTVTTGKFVDGSADEIQMRVQGNATQTSTIFSVEKSDATSLIAVSNTAGTAIKGTTTNTTAGAGIIGEVKTVSLTRASANGLVNNTTENLLGTTLDLTAGNWVISFTIGFVGASGTTITGLDGALSATTGTLPATSTLAVPNSTGECWIEMGLANIGTGVWDTFVTSPTYHVSLSGSQSLYLVVRGNFAGSTLGAYGSVHARRVY